MGHSQYDDPSRERAAWNAGKKVGTKRPLTQKQIRAVRFFLDREGRIRDRALFDLAIDSKLRGCDLIKIRIRDLVAGPEIRTREIVVQQNTGRPVQFEITSDACLSTEKVNDQYGSRAPCGAWTCFTRRSTRCCRSSTSPVAARRCSPILRARSCAALRAAVSKDGKKLSYVFWFSSPSPSADAYLGGQNTASGFIADVLDGESAIKTRPNGRCSAGKASSPPIRT